MSETANIEITEAAATRIQEQLAKRGHGLGLRVGVRSSGCSGYAYALDYADAVEADDVTIQAHGATVVVSREHLALLEGLRLDFRREGLNQMYHFENPNVVDHCGCGESFAVAS
ncbi:HesB/IscA family protein [Abyssibacter profundi]|uniref:Iron-sulfur cluster assembly protein IscA n=1 Tax=Abyssibacter profundi TaxID=2182787 RepID=A0A363UJS5_9GAMM|nr:iron-sulfur cluster assembly accessory protein [Abyssibacter profundi]MBV60616.1 iron-sulfur cluster assembly protein IscA [Nevskiales bacterium]PWN55627.1 iron-sulfur cluster assembly protein IscA [Abyssibacter profundi]